MAVALIVAAGSGERLGAGRPKALVELAGRPLLQWSVDALRAIAGDRADRRRAAAGRASPRRASIGVEGGATRSESVRRALAAAGDAGDRCSCTTPRGRC